MIGQASGPDGSGSLPIARRLIGAARQRLSGSSGWLMAGETINRGGRFLLLLLLAREVGAESYGSWVLAIATATILANAGDAAIGTIAARDIAADRERTNRYYASLLGLTPLLALLGLGVVLVLAALAPGGASRTLILLVGLGGVLESAGYLLLSPLRGHGRFRPEGLFRAFQGMTLLIVGGGAVLISRGNAAVIAPLFPLIAIAALALAAVAVVRTFGMVRPRFDSALVRHLAGSSLPLFASTIAFFIYFRIDAYLLAFIKGEEATGLYGAAYNFAFGLAFLPLMLGRGALTRFAACRTLEELRPAYRRTTVLTGLLAGGLSVLLLAAAPLFLLLYGSDFSGAQTPYLFLIAAQALYFFTHLNYVLIIARGRTRLVWGLTLFALAVNLSANAALIPPLAATGAALAMVISEAALLAIQTVIIRTGILSSRAGAAVSSQESVPGEEPQPRAA